MSEIIRAHDFFLPQPSERNRPIDVVRIVNYYAKQAGVKPNNADYARMGYNAARGRLIDANVSKGFVHLDCGGMLMYTDSHHR